MRFSLSILLITAVSIPSFGSNLGTKKTYLSAGLFGETAGVKILKANTELKNKLTKLQGAKKTNNFLTLLNELNNTIPEITNNNPIVTLQDVKNYLKEVISSSPLKK